MATENKENADSSDTSQKEVELKTKNSSDSSLVEPGKNIEQSKPGECNKEPVKAAGFSDLFCAPPDPDLEADIPISLSSGSLVSMLASGEATPAPTKPPLPHPGSRNASITSLEYPEGYDPLTDSGKCWVAGKDQVNIGKSGSEEIVSLISFQGDPLPH